ncbi:hypothetical protein MTO96_030550 [Rhipicephalus appendiculatus]
MRHSLLLVGDAGNHGSQVTVLPSHRRGLTLCYSPTGYYEESPTICASEGRRPPDAVPEVRHALDAVSDAASSQGRATHKELSRVCEPQPISRVRRRRGLNGERTLPYRPMLTHLDPPRKEQLDADAKYVYVARHPWDCCVSFTTTWEI